MTVIRNIEEFSREILKDVKIHETKIFRGQIDKSWDIAASVFRGKYVEDKEKNIFETISKYNFEEFEIKELYLNTLIKMQHS